MQICVVSLPQRYKQTLDYLQVIQAKDCAKQHFFRLLQKRSDLHHNLPERGEGQSRRGEGQFLQNKLRSRRKPQKVLLNAEELLRLTVEVGLAGASVLDIADGADDGADGDGSGVEGELRKDGIVVGE